MVQVKFHPDLDTLEAVPTLSTLRSKVDREASESIRQRVLALGLERSLEHFGRLLSAAFIASRAPSAPATIEFEVDTPEGTRHFSVTASGDGVSTRFEGAADPTAKVTLSVEDFARFITGLLPVDRLRVDQGDAECVAAFPTWFRTGS